MKKRRRRGGMETLRNANQETLVETWKDAANGDPYSKKTDARVARRLTKALGTRVSPGTWQKYRMEVGLVSCRKKPYTFTRGPRTELSQEATKAPGEPCTLEEMKEALLGPQEVAPLVDPVVFVREAIKYRTPVSIDYSLGGGLSIRIGA